MKNNTLTTAAFILTIVLTSFIASCGGGGDGGGGDGDDDGGSGTTLSAAYTPDAFTTGSGDIVLEYNDTESTAREPVFNVTVYGPLVDNTGTGGGDERVYGIAFHLGYDSSVLEYVDTTFTDALDDGACSGTCVLTESTQGTDEVIIGMSRSGAVDGVPINVSAVMMKIRFRASAKGTSRLEFLETVPGSDCGTAGKDPCRKLSDSSSNDISASWYGGAVDVT